MLLNTAMLPRLRHVARRIHGTTRTMALSTHSFPLARGPLVHHAAAYRHIPGSSRFVAAAISSTYDSTDGSPRKREFSTGFFADTSFLPQSRLSNLHPQREALRRRATRTGWIVPAQFGTASSSQSGKPADKEQTAEAQPQGTPPTPVKQKAPNAASHLSWKTVFRAMVGNTAIAVLKFTAWFHTGSGAMFSEAIHTLADCGNQALLLAGLQQASHAPDQRHQYGYGKAAYFWALVSALGMFWTGAGVSLFQGLYHLQHPPSVFESHAVVLPVLAISFAVDGYVLVKTLQEIEAIRPKDISLFRYMANIRDPFLLAVVLEDAAACTGVLIASAGIGMTYLTGEVFWDTIASMAIGGLLGAVALRLARVNQQYLMGQAVDKDITNDIGRMISERPAIDAVYGVQSQWLSPQTFSFKAEVDFNGAYLAKQLHGYYSPLFQKTDDPKEIEDMLNWFGEDITTLVEQEVQVIEDMIKLKYPAAAYIELEPDSKNSYMKSSSAPKPEFPEETGARNIILRDFNPEDKGVKASEVVDEASKGADDTDVKDLMMSQEEEAARFSSSKSPTEQVK